MKNYIYEETNFESTWWLGGLSSKQEVPYPEGISTAEMFLSKPNQATDA